MAFRLDPKKPLDDEIRRAGLELIDDAISILRDRPSGRHEAVHDARKRFKRLRALYRLISAAVPDFSRAENARFRDIARSLAFARDTAALVETADYLQAFVTSDTQGEALRSVAAILRARRDGAVDEDAGLEDAIGAAIAGCEEGRDSLKALSLPRRRRKTAKLLRKGWARQRKQARRALGHCRVHGDVDHFHDLRKAGQAYWMHLGLLRRLWPSAMRAKKADTKRLVDLLGHEHDLSVLAAVADQEAERFGDGERLSLLLDAVTARQQALRVEALPLADRVFSESARAESRIVATLWRRAAK